MISIFVEQIWLLADALNADIDEVTINIEAIPAEQDHQIFDRLLRAGMTGGTWSAGAPASPASRSRRCGRSAGSTRSIGPHPSTAGH